MKNAFRSGKRIYFRPLEASDLAACQAWMNDPENLKYLGRVKALDQEEEKEWLKSIHSKEGLSQFGIALRLEDRLIGSCSLSSSGLPHRAADLGIAIGDRELQGQGYGSEAMRLLLEYGFGTLGLHRISLRVYANNPRAIRCYEGCGFRREGVRREARWWDGRWWDVLEYAILDHEWHALSPQGAAT